MPIKSVINIKRNDHLFDSVNTNWKCINFKTLELIFVVVWIETDYTGKANEVVCDCVFIKKVDVFKTFAIKYSKHSVDVINLSGRPTSSSQIATLNAQQNFIRY